MRVHLIRHGDAIAGEDDLLRTLTLDGRRAVRRVGEALARHGARVGRVVSSPLPRALQTAEILVAALGFPAAVETDARLLPDVPARVTARLVKEVGEDALLVGHEPLLSALAAFLLERPAFPGLKKTEVVCLELPPGGVAWALDPKTLEMRPG